MTSLKQYLPQPIQTSLTASRKAARKWRRILSRLYHDGELDRPDFFIFHDKKLIYIPIAKAACSSIKQTIARSYGFEVGESTGVYAYQVLQYENGKPSRFADQYTIFSFVRNPYSRLVSCYLDKVINLRKNYKIPYFTKASASQYPYHLPATLTFAEFVKRIGDIPDFLADRHFKSQHASLLLGGKLLPHFIGRVETITQDWAQLASRYGFSAQLAHANPSANKEHPSPPYQAYYTDELARLVYRRYQKDFEMFGYSSQL